MDDQPRYDAQEASAFFADGKAMREPVAGTVALGELADEPAFATGRTSAGEPVARLPVPVDDALLARGEERYGIYCGPCHGADGSGQSMLRERSGVATADLLQERLVQETDGHLFDVITNGLGLMQGYGYPIEPRDRWAIVAWVRELQRRAGAEPYGGGGAEGPGGEPVAAGAGEEAP
ncbi:MAG: c-type cytochrome [Thermoanaerobaculia bacterium]